MKGFFFLFGCYLLSLMVMPCPDGRVLNRQAESIITAARQDHNHNGAETCPPFCSCSCCYRIATVMPAVSFVYEKPALLNEHPVCAYTDKRPDNFKDHVWQPPRLS